MPPLIKFILRRLFFIITSFIVITAFIYAGVMLTPPESRAELYLPPNLPSRMTEEQYQNYINKIIEKYGLNDPYPVQYIRWMGSVLRGTWGYSPTLHEDVLTSMLRRTPATVELTLYSLLVFIPLGVVTGALAAERVHKSRDFVLQLGAFLATAVPPFILALFLISIFYAGLHWFPTGRITTAVSFAIRESSYHQYTGSLDGLLNGRLDITADALRHLVLPVFTLSLFHWATLQRITRASMLDEMGKEYLLAVRARGMSQRRTVWKHALRNVFSPVLTSTILSAASLLTGVFVVEIIYNFQGVSWVITRGVSTIPDAPAAVGFALYCILAVLSLMFILDVIQAWLDPRYREGILDL